MSELPTMRVSVPADVVMTEVEGEAILLNLASGQYYGLDEVGTRMWSLLAKSGELEQVLQALLDEYDVDESQLQRDLLELIQKMVAEGLLRIDGA